jgi:trimeric autotransporter adhesin
MASSNSLT